MRLLSSIAIGSLCGSLTIIAASTARGDDKLDFFEKKIRPVLVQHCYECHSAKKITGGLTVDTRAGLLAGGESGPAIVPGKPKEGTLLGALRHDDLEMPKDKPKLAAAIIADFETWIKNGAVDPRDGAAPVARNGIDFEAGRKHWAFQPVKVVPAAKVAGDWPRSEVDRYVLATLSTKQLTPAADGKPHTILRRLAYDLTGLPPTRSETDEFIAGYQRDPQKAVAAAVDRYLASPRFGENWARHWLDGVRFNIQIASTEHYRDWVVRALNDDVPFDKFIRLQLAGDLLPAESDAERDDQLIATQFLCLNVREMDRFEGMMEVVGQQLLGVSLNCAKCHDHKFDPFSQQDYYALAGIFTSTKIVGDKNPHIDGSPLAMQAGFKIMTLGEGKVVADTNLLIRGELDQRGPVIPRRFPQVIAGDQQQPLGEQTKDSGRLLLAEWITSPENPLTARVLANRVWLRLFGRGIVNTPNDFGLQGEPPSHPELLDYLADRLVQAKWSLKGLIREVALSRTYQLSSVGSAAARESDPDNQYLLHGNVRRLQYEQFIDTLLVHSGSLQLASPPRDPKKRSFDYRFGGKEPIAKLKSYRALYHEDAVNRGLFDGADPELLIPQREASVTAPQLLFILNHPTVLQIAAVIAERAEREAGGEENYQPIDLVYRELFARHPTEAERAEGLAFVKQHSLSRYCHVLLASHEFLYLD